MEAVQRVEHAVKWKLLAEEAGVEPEPGIPTRDNPVEACMAEEERYESAGARSRYLPAMSEEVQKLLGASEVADK